MLSFLLFSLFASGATSAPLQRTYHFHNNCPTAIDLWMNARKTDSMAKGATVTKTSTLSDTMVFFTMANNGGGNNQHTIAGFHDSFYFIVKDPAHFNTGIGIAPHTKLPQKGFCQSATCNTADCSDAFTTIPTTFPTGNLPAVVPYHSCDDTGFDVTFCPTGVWPGQPVPADKWEIHPGFDNNDKCLDVKGNVQENGTPVEIYDCNGTPAQQWNIVRGSTKVQLAGTNYCLDAGTNPASGTGMKIWQCYANLAAQQWYYTDDNHIYVENLNPGQCLDLDGGILTNGNKVQTWTCDGNNANQVWTLSGVRVIPVQPIVHIHPNGNNNKCLDVRAAVLANGTPVQIYDCNGTPAQDWKMAKGSTNVQLANTNFCLDAGSAPASGVGMKIWQCYDNLAAQQWYYTDDNHIAVENLNPGQCLDLTNGVLTNGNQVQTWTCDGNNANQVWTVTS